VSPVPSVVKWDVAIVGAGAAGLAAAIFVRRANPARSVVLLDGARKPGAKILISGGTRCNVTNRVVTERDFWGGRRSLIRRVLRAFTADDAVRFFQALGVPLHEEADGKLFPDSNRSRDVLNALVGGVDSAGVLMRTDHRVLDIQAAEEGFCAATTGGAIRCRSVVLATGGESLPKTGSDGAGFQFARRFGHTIVPTTPALVPLVLDETLGDPMHRSLSGVSHDVELSLWVDGRITTRQQGSLLWTHFGISGPVTLNVSRQWLRAEREGRRATLTASFCPGHSFERLEACWTANASRRPKSTVLAALAAQVPASVGAALLARLQIDLARELAHVTRAERRRLVHALLEWPLPVIGCRGYNYAEATAGGVTLDEVNPATMESRLRPGLFLIGEMLDVDGRIGGFNFQWAWSTAFVAASALGRATCSTTLPEARKPARGRGRAARPEAG
jgi:predicted Rossmann fold flavoprotein